MYTVLVALNVLALTAAVSDTEHNVGSTKARASKKSDNSRRFHKYKKNVSHANKQTSQQNEPPETNGKKKTSEWEIRSSACCLAESSIDSAFYRTPIMYHQDAHNQHDQLIGVPITYFQHKKPRNSVDAPAMLCRAHRTPYLKRTHLLFHEPVKKHFTTKEAIIVLPPKTN